MDNWTHCRRAKEDADKINAMIAEHHGDRELEFENLHEAMVCAIYNMLLCKHEMRTADHEDWKDYNREMYHAVYPEDNHSEALTETEAKTWVAKMPSWDAKENREVKGQRWDMHTIEGVFRKYSKTYGVDTSELRTIDCYAAMHMMYSDYCHTAKLFDIADDVMFYVSLACDFLLDEDGGKPCAKLYRYYKGIVLKA